MKQFAIAALQTTSKRESLKQLFIISRVYRLAGSSSDLLQLAGGWAQSCACGQVTGHLRAEWSLINRINQLSSVWSTALSQPCCHGDHKETREEAETCKASSGLDSDCCIIFVTLPKQVTTPAQLRVGRDYRVIRQRV